MIRAFALIVWAAPVAAQDIFVLGEVHDHPAHHLLQAERVAEIVPSALVFEMLTPGQAAAGAAADWSDEAALGAALDWESGGWPDFSMYYPIFEAAPEGVALYGAAVGREPLMQAMEGGAEAVASQPLLIPEMGEAELAERIVLQSEAHCNALPEEMLPGMVEAQRLRDAEFAATALQALDETGGPVVVIAGTGHARTDWGIPASIAAARPEVEVFALGQVEGDAPEEAPFDEVIVTEPVDRPDPCAAFE
ncbi:ChaN family lipoprotein [Histidinibacterium aquaticum]|uniref:ChaN family lipoprotein n=1 Tax=Histidinibacterium aquaticum TaxID=2613962 RepID=A0A5J5GQ06_9RHOB|nr:ChaN family lipoprotein [Histidinibacterium aquaticum]KAA9010456.1 ChaN family lipoprotein [Histidinibacterium aquaticum]